MIGFSSLFTWEMECCTLLSWVGSVTASKTRWNLAAAVARRGDGMFVYLHFDSEIAAKFKSSARLTV